MSQYASNEYFFCVGSGVVKPAVRKQLDRIAKRHDASFENPSVHGGYRYWFVTENRGEPSNRDIERAVVDEVREAGLLHPSGRLSDLCLRRAS